MFVSFHLDYCNDLFTSLDKSSLSRLQAIRKAAESLNTLRAPLSLSLHSQMILWVILNFSHLHA